MSVRADVLLWAQRVISRKGAPAHQILHVRASDRASGKQQEAHLQVIGAPVRSEDAGTDMPGDKR
jgi:hypothetical protein